jgi:hypothetical protein
MFLNTIIIDPFIFIWIIIWRAWDGVSGGAGDADVE